MALWETKLCSFSIYNFLFAQNVADAGSGIKLLIKNLSLQVRDTF